MEKGQGRGAGICAPKDVFLLCFSSKTFPRLSTKGDVCVCVGRAAD